MPFGEAFARFIQYQRMVKISGFGQSEQTLQDAVDMGGSQQVFSPRDMGYALERVIRDHREMIGYANVLAREHHVAEQVRIHRDDATV